jgi:hypothetical protein
MEEPVLSDLVAETHALRETILRRVAAVVGLVDKSSVAEAIVDSKIGEFLFAADYAEIRRKLLEGGASDSRALTLLVLECLADMKSGDHATALADAAQAM